MAAKKKYDRTKQKETLVKVLEYIKHYRSGVFTNFSGSDSCMYALSSYSDRRCYQFDFITGTGGF